MFTVSPVPSLGSAPTGICVPLLKVRVADVIWSLRLGRSKSTIVARVTGLDQVSFSQLPAPPPTVAHSLV